MLKHVNITLTGKVQKVGFRFAVLDEALELGLTGFVKNQDPRQLYIEAEGEVEQLKKLLHFCKTGPSGAKIDDMKYESSEELKNFAGFNIDFL